MKKACIKDRVCKECGKGFSGDRWTCPQCRSNSVRALTKKKKAVAAQ